MSPSTSPSKAPTSPDLARLAGAGGHNPVLDGVRGLAILLVMWHHLTVFSPSGTVDGVYHGLTGMGAFGVDLFFVLSGFLITGILHDAKGTPNYFRNFYARRTLRIFPLYYAVVAISLIVLPHLLPWIIEQVAHAHSAGITARLKRFSEGEQFAPWFWLYASNIAIAKEGNLLHPILGVSWSLAIEEQFYLAWPMIVYFLSRRGAIRACLALIGMALAIRIGLTFHGMNNPPPAGREWIPFANPLGVYTFTLCRIDALAMGALVSLWLRGPTPLDKLVKPAKLIVLVGLPALVALALFEASRTGPDGRPLKYQDSFGTGFGPIFQTIGYTLMGLVCASGLVLAISSRPGGIANRVWNSTFMRTFGKYAYALYLFHLPIRAVIRDTLFGPHMVNGAPGGAKIKFPLVLGSELPAQLVFYVIAGAAALAAAWVSWRIFEQPILRLKRFFPSGAESRRTEQSSRAA